MPHVNRYQLDSEDLNCKYCYNVTQGTDIIGGFVLEYVRPYNIMDSKEYVFKRTAMNVSLDDLQYLGKETEDASKNSTNYVVDPTSTDKSKASYKYPKNTVEYWAKILMMISIKLIMQVRPIRFQNQQRQLVVLRYTILRQPFISWIT